MAFELPRFGKCCYCIPMRIASLIIGYVSIVGSCLTIAFISWSIYKVATYIETNQGNGRPVHTPEEVAKTALGLYISFAYYQIVFLYNLVLGIVLVVGVHKNNTNYLRFYCKATLILFVLGLSLVVLSCIFMGFMATVPILKWCLTLFCCLIIVRSTYLEMEDNEKPSPGEMTDHEMQPYIVQQPLMA